MRRRSLTCFRLKNVGDSREIRTIDTCVSNSSVELSEKINSALSPGVYYFTARYDFCIGLTTLAGPQASVLKAVGRQSGTFRLGLCVFKL